MDPRRPWSLLLSFVLPLLLSNLTVLLLHYSLLSAECKLPVCECVCLCVTRLWKEATPGGHVFVASVGSAVHRLVFRTYTALIGAGREGILCHKCELMACLPSPFSIFPADYPLTNCIRDPDRGAKVIRDCP